MASPIEKLGQLLLRQNLITPTQLAQCLEEHRTRGAGADVEALSDIILSHGFIDRVRLTGAMQSAGWSSMADEVPPGTSSEPPEVLEARRDPKRVLRKFTLVSELGRGGMAVVYKAWDDALRKFVALKLIRTQDIGLEGAAEDADVQDFLREARTAAKLSHPNIVRVHELGRHDDRYFLSMEYVEGHTLEELLRPDRKQPLCQEFYARPKRFLVLLRDVARALDHAHRQSPPIVHRDIKPQNILVDGTGRACVVDFGLAREMSSGHTLTSTGIVRGTPSYMAPEQALGRGGPGVDARTDVWALGAVLYECLAGVPPFLGPTQRDILNKVVNEDALPPSEIHRRRASGREVPPDLERICLHALEKDKAKRYRSAREFAEDVDRVLAGGTAKARGVTRRAKAWSGLDRRKGVLAAAAAGLLLAAVAALVLLRRPPPERIVEKVVVESDAGARLREAQEKIRLMAEEMRYDRASRGYQELLSTLEAGKDRDALHLQLEEIRLQESLLAELVLRIQERPRDLPKLKLKDAVLAEVRLLDATSEAIVLRYQGRVVEVPWGKLAPAQFAGLVRELCPRLIGDAALGYLAWAGRQVLPLEATWAAASLRGTSREPKARQLFAKAGLTWEEPAAAPPPPSMAPAALRPPPSATRPPAAFDRPAPPSIYRPSTLPAVESGTYVAAWKHHGASLAEALSRRGWSDWAAELASNAVLAPGASPREKADARMALARIHAVQAERGGAVAEQLRLLDWSVQGMRSFLASSPSTEAYEEAVADLIRVEGIRARALAEAGHRTSVRADLDDLVSVLAGRFKVLSRGSGTSGAERADLRRAQYQAGAAELSRAWVLLDLRLDRPEAREMLRKVKQTLCHDLLWQTEQSPLGFQVQALRAAACMGLAEGESGPLAVAEVVEAQACLQEALRILEASGLRGLPELSGTAARIVLFGMRARLALAERGPATAKAAEAVKILRVAADLYRAFPEARTGPFSTSLRREEARAWEASGRPDRALQILEMLPGSPSLRAGADAKVLAAMVAADPRDAEIVAARQAIVAERRRIGIRIPAEAWLRLGIAYVEAGRDLEAIEAFKAMEDPRIAQINAAGSIEAALRQLVALRRIHETTGDASDKRAFESFRDRTLSRHGTAADPAGPAFLALWETQARVAPPRRRLALPEDPLAPLYVVPPGETEARSAPRLPRALAPRTGEARLAAAKGGLDGPGQNAVLAALRWLSRHQSPDGSWKAVGYVAECKKVSKYSAGGNCTPNPGSEDFDGGLTGLALLAFLGAGYTHQSTDTFDGICFGDVVRRALQWLLSRQDPEGCLGGRQFEKYQYGHAICAMAVAEAYGMTGSGLLKEAAQKAADFTVLSQNPGKGWRYSFRCGDNDSSVTGWSLLSLKAAEVAGLSFPRTAYEGVRSWYDEVTEDAYGRVGYTHRGTGKVFVPGLNEQFDHHEALTAIGVVARLFMDKTKAEPRLTSGCDLLMRDKPRWDGNQIDFYYWHFATLALYHFDGPSGTKWKSWNDDLTNSIVPNQNTGSSGCKNGSWETIDRWSGEGGRVYTTALNALTLLTPVRYAPVVEPAKK